MTATLRQVFISAVLAIAILISCENQNDCDAASTERILFDKLGCSLRLHNISANANEPAPDVFNVRWKTTASETDLVIQIYRHWAPRGVDRFYHLLLDNYYNCATFFRVVPGMPIVSLFVKS